MKNQLIDIIYVNSLIINNTICSKNNLKYENYKYLGGCFRSENVVERIYLNVSISKVYSDYTTVGIKIIDSNTILQQITQDNPQIGLNVQNFAY